MLHEPVGLMFIRDPRMCMDLGGSRAKMIRSTIVDDGIRYEEFTMPEWVCNR